EHGNGDRHRGRAHQRRRARAEKELEDLREARGDERRGDARVREDDQELDHLERCEIRRRTLSHRPRTAPTTAARGELLDQVRPPDGLDRGLARSEEHTSELQSLAYLVCRLLLEKKKKTTKI